jgi:hypothetical protein
MTMISSREKVTMDSQFETLAAWVDGEPVSRTEVATALETPEGRDYVLDLMALRHMVAVTTPGLVAKPAPSPAQRWKTFAAAAAVVLCAAGGFAAGRLLSPDTTPSTEALDGRAVPISAAVPQSAPAPTRVIQLDEGTSWRESGGS